MPGLPPLVGQDRALGDEPAGEQALEDDGERTPVVAQRLRQWQHEAVLAGCGGGVDDALGVGKFGGGHLALLRSGAL
ncbi:MAG: hypothetical protein ACYC0C_03535 [Devosia sp.]